MHVVLEWSERGRPCQRDKRRWGNVRQWHSDVIVGGPQRWWLWGHCVSPRYLQMTHDFNNVHMEVICVRSSSRRCPVSDFGFGWWIWWVTAVVFPAAPPETRQCGSWWESLKAIRFSPGGLVSERNCWFALITALFFLKHWLKKSWVPKQSSLPVYHPVTHTHTRACVHRQSGREGEKERAVLLTLA